MRKAIGIYNKFIRLKMLESKTVVELYYVEPDSIEELRLKLRLDNIRFAMERGIE